MEKSEEFILVGGELSGLLLAFLLKNQERKQLFLKPHPLGGRFKR